MKTSTKLILIYGGLIVAGTIAIYLSPSLFNDKYKHELVKQEQFIEQLPDFSVVVIEDSTMCSVTQGDSSRILWHQPIGSVRKPPLTIIRNDTLYVSHVTKGTAILFNIKAKHLTSIIVKNKGYLELFEPMQDKLYVQLENALCTLTSTENEEKAAVLSKTLHLTFNASNKSTVQLFSSIDALTATLDDSRLETFGSCFIREVTLNLKNGSASSFFTSSEQMNVQRDAESVFQIK